MSFIYLATPYTHERADIMSRRYDAAVSICAQLFNQGEFVFSPIVHCHPIAITHDLLRDYIFWQRYSERMISAANEVWVVKLPGWKESRGISAEMEFAAKQGIPIIFCEFNEFENMEDFE
jgi:Domain of unknown function (DUF1937)